MDGSQSEVQLARGERERKEDLVCDQTGSVLIRESRLGKIDARGGMQVGEILGGRPWEPASPTNHGCFRKIAHL